jgi:hypothetical protein
MAIYGLVQAARQLWKKLKEVLATLNFIPSQADVYSLGMKMRKDPA